MIYSCCNSPSTWCCGFYRKALNKPLVNETELSKFSLCSILYFFFFNVPWPGISHRAVDVLPSSKGSQCFGGKLFISCTQASQKHSLGSLCDGALAFLSPQWDNLLLFWGRHVHIVPSLLPDTGSLKRKKKTQGTKMKEHLPAEVPLSSPLRSWRLVCVCLLWNGLSCPSWIRGRQPHL